MQFQIGPVIHWVTDSQFQRLSKLPDAQFVVGITGDFILTDTVGAHHAPLIVVTEIGAVRVFPSKPDLREVIKADILVNIFRGDVAMKVYQREMFGIIVEEMLRGFGFKEKVFVHEFFHAGNLQIKLMYEKILILSGVFCKYFC